MKKMLVIWGLLIVAVIVVASRSRDEAPTAQTVVTPVAERPSPPAPDQIHMHEFAAVGRVPAYYTTAPDPAALPPTLAPEVFTGNKKLAYQAAKEIPQILAQLPCYCHCDRGHGHKSLHSCFESEHGEGCGICIAEAVMAHNLHKEGASVVEIRKQIIAAYGSSGTD
jgi:hypothetical protein